MDDFWDFDKLREVKFRSESLIVSASKSVALLTSFDQFHFIAQLIDVCMGLEFLHSIHIVHRDLKGVSRSLIVKL